MTSKFKILENMIRRIVREEANSELLNKPFWVLRIGGPIGQGKGNFYLGKGPVVASFNTAEEAKSYASKMRKSLSPGEKQFYKMSYVVVPANMKRIR